MPANTAASIPQYSRAWYEKMVEIWKDRLAMMRAVDTGALRQSVSGRSFSVGDTGGTMSFHFLLYGIYVDAGTGKGYKRGNPGDLEFLGKAYRKAHGLGRPRQKRPWFSPSWNISQRVLADHTAAIVGDKFIGIFDEYLDAKS